MKVVGEFKGSNIYLESIHVKRTYGDFLGLNGNILNEANQFLFKSIPEDFELYNPRELPVVIIKDGLDSSKLLPSVMVIGEFYCGIGSSEDYEESALIVVWFQERDENFFIRAEEIIKRIAWLRLAKDFNPKKLFG